MAVVKVKLKDGTMLTADAFKQLAQKTSNLAILDIDEFIQLNHDGTEVVNLNDAAIGKLLKLIFNDLRINNPAIAQIIANGQSNFPPGRFPDFLFFCR